MATACLAEEYSLLLTQRTLLNPDAKRGRTSAQIVHGHKAHCETPGLVRSVLRNDDEASPFFA
jgi:hypothetical protein